MKKTMKRVALLGLALGSLGLHSCKKEEVKTTTPTPESSKYIMSIVTDLTTQSGILAVVDAFPSGDIDVSTLTNTKQIAYARDGGFSFNGAYYQCSNAAGDPGIQKFVIGADGKIADGGFIAGGERSFAFGMISTSKGYYYNNKLGEKKLQIFNPTSMSRTGEIDCSSAIDKYTNSKVVSTDIGNYIIHRDGKAFVQVFYNDSKGNSVIDSTFLAVIDVNTDKVEKVLIHPEFLRLGYYSMPNCNWINLDENNDIYISTFMGNFGGRVSFRALRIKSGQTEFDSNFKIDTEKDMGGLGFALGCLSHKGKIYTKMFGSPVPPNFSNLANKDYYVYEIDPISKTATKIQDIPVGYWKSINGPMLFNNKIYFVVENDDQGVAYYYSYDPTTKTSKKEITMKGGQPQQILKL